MNKYQKAARKRGEQRVGGDQIEQLLEMSRSDDPGDRLVAAEYLCPCRVRRRIDSVWQALFRMLEDADARVRRAAWHTLDDGGCPNDPALDEIFARVLCTETDAQVRGFVEKLGAPRKTRERMAVKLAGRSAFTQRGKCDFCGRLDVRARNDYDTSIPVEEHSRSALICERCDQSGYLRI